MKASSQKKNVRRFKDTAEFSRKLLHSARERARHRFLMQTLESLGDQLPLNGRVFRSKSSQLRGTIEYYKYLEETIHTMCVIRRRDIPPHCDLFATSHDHRLIKAMKASTKKASRACRKKVQPPSKHTEKFARGHKDKRPPKARRSSSDDAIVPDVDFPSDMCHTKEENEEWELYGISREDWMAAGSSQQESSQHSSDQAVPPSSTLTYVNLITDTVTTKPLKEAPEYFVVSSEGEVISLGDLVYIS